MKATVHYLFNYLIPIKVFHNHVLFIAYFDKETKSWNVRTIGCTGNFRFFQTHIGSFKNREVFQTILFDQLHFFASIYMFLKF